MSHITKWHVLANHRHKLVTSLHLNYRHQILKVLVKLLVSNYWKLVIVSQLSRNSQSRLLFLLLSVHVCVQWRRKGERRVGTVQGAAFWGAKIGNSVIWSLLANWHLHCRSKVIFYTPKTL